MQGIVIDNHGYVETFYFFQLDVFIYIMATLSLWSS